ncbi:unnamed protein product [Mesocestoides corti]|uniref:LanC-like protein 3 homolog n=1 Tax=Mesocestoides corti TaxID=53468 RepID=A0A3P6GHW7_MESCO|nr:unnamed protein product [Mesocestoides corti]
MLGSNRTKNCRNSSRFIMRNSILLQGACRKVSIHDGGLYVGGVGVSWAAIRVIKRIGAGSELIPQIRGFMEKLVNRAAQDAPRDKSESLSFLLGRPGIWLTAASLYQFSGEIPERDRFLGLYCQLAPHFASLKPGGCEIIFPQGSDELFIGRAGYLCGLYELRRQTSEASCSPPPHRLFLHPPSFRAHRQHVEVKVRCLRCTPPPSILLCTGALLKRASTRAVVSDETIFAICDAIISSGQAYAQKHRSQCPLMFAYHGTEYLGEVWPAESHLHQPLLRNTHLDSVRKKLGRTWGLFPSLRSLFTTLGLDVFLVPLVFHISRDPMANKFVSPRPRPQLIDTQAPEAFHLDAHELSISGAAHGLAGILFALMLFPQYLNARASARRLVKEAINYLVSVTPTSTGNLPAATDEVDARHGRSAPSDELVHWCHGASGEHTRKFEPTWLGRVVQAHGDLELSGDWRDRDDGGNRPSPLHVQFMVALPHLRRQSASLSSCTILPQKTNRLIPLGAVYAYARAYVLWKDEVYLREAARCADVAWGGGLLKKGPGICHGVAGSGYTQLALYRITGEERYLDRARACAAFMDEETFLRGSRTPDSPLSLFEGRAGTAVFLADLANPAESAFPFMDVFGV